MVCDACQCSTRVACGEPQFATLLANWGYGAKHDGERYELHICEGCFFGTLAYLKQEWRMHNMFSDDDNSYEAEDSFGLVATDDYFGYGNTR